MNLKRAAAAAVFAAALPVAAKCIANDSFRGADKVQHFGGGVAIAAAVTLHTRDPWTGFYAGAAAGVAKEVLDASGSGTCSLQDLLVTVAGSAVGAATGHLLITRIHGRTTVAYVTTF